MGDDSTHALRFAHSLNGAEHPDIVYTVAVRTPEAIQFPPKDLQPIPSPSYYSGVRHRVFPWARVHTDCTLHTHLFVVPTRPNDPARRPTARPHERMSCAPKGFSKTERLPACSLIIVYVLGEIWRVPCRNHNKDLTVFKPTILGMMPSNAISVHSIY